MPRFTGIMSGIKVQADARQLAGVLRMARVQAVATGDNQNVEFHIEEGNYEHYNHATYRLSEGVEYVGNKPFISLHRTYPACKFNAQGGVERGGTVALKCGDKKKYVIVLSTTGRIRVSDYPP